MSDQRAIQTVECCPSCKAALDRGGLVCKSCGGVVALEIASGRMRSVARGLFSRIDAQHGDQFTLLWILALIPVLIGPPVIALLMVYNARKQPGDANRFAPDARRERDYTFIVLVACLNILVSMLFWRWASEGALGLAYSFWQNLKSIGFGGLNGGGARTWGV